MVALGFGVLWWGYLELVYGYTLLKGYDVTWKELANPIHPYQWPAKGQTVPLIPAGQILPGGAARKAAGGSGSGPGPAPNPQPGPQA